MSVEDAVVWVDKLSGMDSASDIAGFLRAEGVAGELSSSFHCVVAEFLREKTGVHAIVTAIQVTVWETKSKDGVFLPVTQSVRRPSSTLHEFITLFDQGDYPELTRPATAKHV